MSSFPTPRENRYFEDYVVGSTHEFGPIAATEEEMVAFARRYDPQSFHLDAKAGKKTHFGGLVASGWFTAGLVMRLWVENVVSSVASLGSPGVDELRWLLPVRPGDQLSIRVQIREARRSKSRPDWGIVGFSLKVMNQNGDVVMTMKTVGMFLCREKIRS